MSGKTLDYGSVEKWMSLTVWATRVHRSWDANTFHPRTDAQYTNFFHEIAVEALNMGFSLRAGYRSWAVGDMLRAIAPQDTDLYAAFLRIDKETWLTKPGERRKSHV